ncbi:MAG: glycosyltransferase family A protein [Candidatus Saccharibacteria bacterium]|nr:glycosyltransferase family A protein [Candidatus Saccharibacteria bacterium]
MKVSIIIPIYNKEKYLERCIKSVLAQSHSDLEIILVDDGSTDNSLEICKKYKKDKRTKIFHQENKGVSSARNVGLKNMTGERVIFIDADDYIEKGYIKKISEYDDDLVISGYIINNIENTPEPQQNPSVNEILSRKNSKYIVVPYDKLFKTNLIQENGIKFDESMNFGEDACFVLDYLKFCKTTRFIKYAGYHNIILDGTLSRKYIENIAEQLNKLYTRINSLTKNNITRAYWRLRNIKLIINNKKRSSK